MIKKYLLGLGISILGLVGFSSANQVFYLNIPAEVLTDTRSVFTLKPGSNFLTNGVKVFAGEDGCNSYGCYQYFLFWYNNKLYTVRNYTYGGDDQQGYVQVKVNDTIVDGNTELTQDYVYPNSSLTSSFYGTDFGSADYLVMGGSFKQAIYCLVYSSLGKSVCWQSNFLDNSASLPVPANDFNMSNLGSSSDPLKSYYGSSSFSLGPKNNDYQPGITETIPTDLDRYIEYYETRFGRNKNMCYVGTNDFTSVYGSGGSFEVGTGLTLNELYYKLYGTFGSNNIKNVGSFVNSWLINYSQWFYAGKQYTVNYNGPDTNITVNYDNITFPFANKPVAIYFMASNLFDYYSIESTQGDEMVYYCQMKINYTFYKNNPDSFKEEVEDKVGSGVNERVQQYYNNQIVNNGSGGFSIPDLSGSVWGYISSGNVLPDDLNPTNLFKDFFTKITNLTKTFSPSSNPLLPDWIVYPLIFLVLFRIFKH